MIPYMLLTRLEKERAFHRMFREKRRTVKKVRGKFQKFSMDPINAQRQAVRQSDIQLSV